MGLRVYYFEYIKLDLLLFQSTRLTMWRKISMSRSTSEATCSPPASCQSPARHEPRDENPRKINCDSLETVVSTSSDRHGHINTKTGKVVINVDEGPAAGSEESNEARTGADVSGNNARQRATSAFSATGPPIRSILNLRASGAETEGQETPPMKRGGIRRKYSIQHGATDKQRECGGPWLHGTKNVSFPALPSISPIPERWFQDIVSKYLSMNSQLTIV